MANAPATSQEQPEEPIPIPPHLDGVAYLYGHPLLNSLSPLLHQTIYDALNLRWAQFPLSSVYGTSDTYPPPYTRSPSVDKFIASIRANAKFVGSSVTMPRKVSIMAHLDELTEEASHIGACNTIFLRHRHGKKLLVGTNTDCIGIREAILQNTHAASSSSTTTTGDKSDEADTERAEEDPPYASKPGLIIGGGGTARAAVYAMRKWLKCSKIYIVNRDPQEIKQILSEDAQRSDPRLRTIPIIAISDPAEAARVEMPAVVVSAIPNYPPRTPEEVRTRMIVQAFLARELKGVFLEMCYHPVPWTELAGLAESAGWKVILGQEAMLWQGLEQARLWTGTDVVAVPGLVQKVKDVLAKAIESKTTPRRSSRSSL
ncbi:hypothetical protein VTO42DRAFT_6485 [Malbranchea cinnamomea]